MADLLGAVLGAVTGFGGGLFDLVSTDRTNNANAAISASNRNTQIQLAQEANEMAYRQFFENLQWQQHQYKQNREWSLEDREYNSPKEVVKRLQEAGINPAYYFGQGQSPLVGGSSPSSVPNSSFQVPHLEASYNLPYDFSAAVGAAVDAYNQTRLVSSEISRKDADTQLANQEFSERQRSFMKRMELLSKQAEHEGYVGDLAKTQLSFESLAQSQKLAQVYNDTRMQERSLKQMDAQYTNYMLQNRLMEIQVAYAPQMNEAQLKQYAQAIVESQANISLTLARADLTEQQKLSEIQSTLDKVLSNGIKAKDFDRYDITHNLALDILDAQGSEAYWKAQSAAKNYRLGRLGSLVPAEYGNNPNNARLIKFDNFRHPSRSSSGNNVSSRSSVKHTSNAFHSYRRGGVR